MAAPLCRPCCHRNIVVRAKNGDSAVPFRLGLFYIALLPVMEFTDVGFMQYSYVADHYQHIALIGITAILGAAAAVAWRKSKVSPHVLFFPWR